MKIDIGITLQCFHNLSQDKGVCLCTNGSSCIVIHFYLHKYFLTVNEIISIFS